ncbi:outer membrane beta-barrel protein [Ramlibacter sp. AW1]|uniref:Outer membrane beta-barrel protein n=1 Tax=Ramlibacter aurantiacus TaxID=2801330 RepID=A0A936ZFX4_9BURK|nr:outer membrane beta-barrel protein [Ramlibacter aurantiacus]
MQKKLNRWALVPAACLCIAWPLAQAQSVAEPRPVDLDPGDSLQFRVGAGIEHDSNVLRAPNASSDNIGVLRAGARYDKRLSLQRIVLDAEVSAYRHRNFDSLDYETLNYTAAWNYAFTPRFRGVISANQREFRDLSVATTGVTSANVRTQRTQLIEGTYAPGGGLLARAGLSNSTSQADNARSLESSPSVRSLRLGAGYETARGSQAILQYRRGDGEYDNLASDFTENEWSVIARWPVTGRTTIDGRLGWLERTHDNAPAFDFDGVIGNINANWEITGKTALAAGIERDLGSYEAAGGGYVRAWTFYVEPVWNATAKTAVRLRYQHEDREWVTRSLAAPDAGRDDAINSFGINVDWEPVRNVIVTGGVRHERRNSTLNAFDFKSNRVGVAARYVF